MPWMQSRWLVLQVGLVCLLTAGLSAAQDSSDAGTSESTADYPATRSAPAWIAGQSFDPQANHILQVWSDQLRAARRFQVEARISVQVFAAGQNELRYGYRLACERPNKLALVPLEKTYNPALICDGTAFYASAPLLGQYTQDPAPPTLDDMGRDNALAALLTGGSALVHLTLLVADDPFKRLTLVARQTRDLGIAEVSGVGCHDVQVVQPNLSLDLWIEAGAEPRLRRLASSLNVRVPAASAPANAAGEPVITANLGATIDFESWSFDTSLPADTFRFAPPAQARRVQNLLTHRRVEPAHPLVGRPAPVFTTTLADGSRWDLGDQKGKAVVVLDFWASWSAGSAERLPIHDNLARTYAGQPIAFLAINTKDTERFATAFLRSNQIGLPVAVDQDGAITRRYAVDKLPVTVLIGPDGTVRAVHRPLPANTEAMLRSEIDELLRASGLIRHAASQPTTKP